MDTSPFTPADAKTFQTALQTILTGVDQNGTYNQQKRVRPTIQNLDHITLTRTPRGCILITLSLLSHPPQPITPDTPPTNCSHCIHNPQQSTELHTINNHYTTLHNTILKLTANTCDATTTQIKKSMDNNGAFIFSECKHGSPQFTATLHTATPTENQLATIEKQNHNKFRVK